jgi:hypothetical protein
VEPPQNNPSPGRYESQEELARRLQGSRLPRDVESDLFYQSATSGRDLQAAYDKFTETLTQMGKLSDQMNDLEQQRKDILTERAEGWEQVNKDIEKDLRTTQEKIKQEHQRYREITSQTPQVLNAATKHYEAIREQDIRSQITPMSDVDLYNAIPEETRQQVGEEKMTRPMMENIVYEQRLREANLPNTENEYSNIVTQLGPAVAAGYMGARVTGPTPDKNNVTADDLLARGFGVQGAMNMFGDLLTPGGPSIGRTVGGMAQQGLGAAPFLADMLPGMAFMGNPAVLATAGAGVVGWNTLMGLQEQTRGYERSFGEDQGLTSPLLGAQVDARLTNWLLASEEIDAVTESLANFGATAEQASEALGPAADALSQYRVLDAETAARAAYRGQQFSAIGASEAGVLGQVMESLAGGGFSAEAINQAAQTSAETYEPLGVPMSEYSGLGVVNMLQAGGPQTDMLLQQSGTAQRSIEIGGSIIADPMIMGTTANMYSSGTDYTSLDPATPRGRAQANFALYDAVWNVSGDLRQNLNRDDQGNIIVTDADNIMSANLVGQMLAPMNGGQPMGGAELLGILATMESQGGREEAFQSMLGPEQMAERLEQERQREIGGSLQEETRGNRMAQGTAQWGEMMDSPMGIVMGSPILGAAPLQGLFGGLASLATGQSAIERGEASGFGSAEMWRQSKGGFMGTLAGVEGQGLFDAGIDPDKVQVVGPGGGRWTLAEVSRDKKLRQRFEAGELRAEVDVGGETQMMTAEDLATAAYNNELKFDTGFMGFGKGKGLTMGETSNGSGGTVQVEFTGTAEEFFRTVDPKNPNSMGGANVMASHGEEAGRGNRELYDVGYHYGG